MEMLNQPSVAGNLWASVVKHAKQDLVLPDLRNALSAARYFFLDPTTGDDSDIRTFAGLCDATRINADAAARAIFNELEPHQQKRILHLLQEVGYEGIRSEVIM